MRALLIVGLLIGFAGNNAYADLDKNDVKNIIGFIGGLIADNIDDKHHKGKPGHKPGKPGHKPPFVGGPHPAPHPPHKPGPKPVFDKEGEALLNHKGNGEIVLGRVFLERYQETDVINLPRCNQSPNRRVDQIKLVVPRDRARITNLVVVYQKGGSETLQVRPNYQPGSETRWINLRGDNDRCIKRIRIDGQSMDFDRAVVRVLGR